jgi:uncharacterized integral membrane protein
VAALRFLAFLGWLAVFAVALLFAIKNTEPATLHFWFDRTWQAPLVFIVVASFAAGAVFGVVACIAPIARQRRAIAALEKELRLRDPAPRAGEPPRPATVPDVP